MSNAESEKQRPADIVCVELAGESMTELRELRDSLCALPGVTIHVKEPLLPLDSPPASAVGSDATLVMVGGDESASLRCLRQRAAVVPRPSLIAVLRDRSAGMMRRILKAGVNDLLFLPLDPAPATRTFLQIANARERSAAKTRGKVCVVTSTAGGVGVTSVAANLALALRYGMDKRVALLDLDARSGGLSARLGLEPVETIASLAKPGRIVDSIELGSAMATHRSGVRLLASPMQLAEMDEMAPEVTEAAIDLMAELFDYVVVDCGGNINRHVVTAWERADHMLYILDQSMNAIRCAWRFAELFEQMKLGPTEPRFVVNRFDAGHPANEEQIGYALGQTIFAKIPADERAMARTEARGVDLWQMFGGSAMTKAYEELAQAIMSGKPVSSTPESTVLPRLLAAIGVRQGAAESSAI